MCLMNEFTYILDKRTGKIIPHKWKSLISEVYCTSDLVRLVALVCENARFRQIEWRYRRGCSVSGWSDDRVVWSHGRPAAKPWTIRVLAPEQGGRGRLLCGARQTDTGARFLTSSHADNLRNGNNNGHPGDGSVMLDGLQTTLSNSEKRHSEIQ